MNKYTTKKQNIYGEYSKTYDEDRRLMVGDRALSSRMDWAFFNLHAGHNLLDLGCGTGGLLLRASTILGETDIACGLDISPDMLSIAKKKLCAHHIGLIQADVAHALPIQNNLFDLVTGLNLLQEIPPSHYMEVFKEIYRVLKLGGWFRGIVPCVMDNSEPNSVFSEEARNRADMHFHPW